MTRILLIRHGSVDLLGRVLYGRMPGVHLNEAGRTEARRVAEGLSQRYRLDEVVSSPMERARETAEFVANAQRLGVAIDEGITELEFGLWKGMSFDDLATREDWKRYNKLRSARKAPGGELMTEVQTRGLRTLMGIAARHETEDAATAAVVTHGDVIRALLILFLGMPLDHVHRLEVAPASVSEILMGSGEPRVRTINETFSLENKNVGVHV